MPRKTCRSPQFRGRLRIGPSAVDFKVLKSEAHWNENGAGSFHHQEGPCQVLRTKSYLSYISSEVLGVKAPRCPPRERYHAGESKDVSRGCRMFLIAGEVPLHFRVCLKLCVPPLFQVRARRLSVNGRNSARGGLSPEG